MAQWTRGALVPHSVKFRGLHHSQIENNSELTKSAGKRYQPCFTTPVGPSGVVPQMHAGSRHKTDPILQLFIHPGSFCKCSLSTPQLQDQARECSIGVVLSGGIYS